jgi:hypothetical protein
LKEKGGGKKVLFTDDWEIDFAIIDRRTGSHLMKGKVSMKRFIDKTLPDIETKIQ